MDRGSSAGSKMDLDEISDLAPRNSRGANLLKQAALVSQMAYDIGTFGNEVDIISILDECGRLAQEKRRLKLDVNRLEAKLKESQFDLNQHRRRISELNDELITTKQEASEWRKRCEVSEQRYESLRRMVTLASDALASPSAISLPTVEPVNSPGRKPSTKLTSRSTFASSPETVPNRIDTCVMDEKLTEQSPANRTVTKSRRSSKSKRDDSSSRQPSRKSLPRLSSTAIPFVGDVSKSSIPSTASHRAWSVSTSGASSTSTRSATSKKKRSKRKSGSRNEMIT